jgi:hypothetical protein
VSLRFQILPARFGRLYFFIMILNSSEFLIAELRDMYISVEDLYRRLSDLKITIYNLLNNNKMSISKVTFNENSFNEISTAISGWINNNPFITVLDADVGRSPAPEGFFKGVIFYLQAVITWIISSGFTEFPDGVYTGGSGQYPDNYAVSTEAMPGEFTYRIDIQDSDSISAKFGVSTVSSNRPFNDATDPWEFAMKIRHTDSVFQPLVDGVLGTADVAASAQYNGGDDMTLVRDANDVIKFYYNETLIHTFGTLAGNLYLHFSARNGKKIFKPRID